MGITVGEEDDSRNAVDRCHGIAAILCATDGRGWAAVEQVVPLFMGWRVPAITHFLAPVAFQRFICNITEIFILAMI